MKTFEIVTDDPYWDRFNDLEDEDYSIMSIHRISNTFPVNNRLGEVVDSETIYTWHIVLEEPTKSNEQIQEIVDILKCQLRVIDKPDKEAPGDD